MLFWKNALAAALVALVVAGCSDTRPGSGGGGGAGEPLVLAEAEHIEVVHVWDDGRYVAFTVGPAETYGSASPRDLVVYDTVARRAHELTEGDAPGLYDAWSSPDGEHLYFEIDEKLFEWSARTGQQHVLLDDFHLRQYRPDDGLFVGYRPSRDYDLVAVDAETGDEIFISEFSYGRLDYDRGPNQRYLLVGSDDEGDHPRTLTLWDPVTRRVEVIAADPERHITRYGFVGSHEEATHVFYVQEGAQQNELHAWRISDGRDQTLDSDVTLLPEDSPPDALSWRRLFWVTGVAPEANESGVPLRSWSADDGEVETLVERAHDSTWLKTSDDDRLAGFMRWRSVEGVEQLEYVVYDFETGRDLVLSVGEEQSVIIKGFPRTAPAVVYRTEGARGAEYWLWHVDMPGPERIDLVPFPTWSDRGVAYVNRSVDGRQARYRMRLPGPSFEQVTDTYESLHGCWNWVSDDEQRALSLVSDGTERGGRLVIHRLDTGAEIELAAGLADRARCGFSKVSESLYRGYVIDVDQNLVAWRTGGSVKLISGSPSRVVWWNPNDWEYLFFHARLDPDDGDSGGALKRFSYSTGEVRTLAENDISPHRLHENGRTLIFQKEPADDPCSDACSSEPCHIDCPMEAYAIADVRAHEPRATLLDRRVREIYWPATYRNGSIGNAHVLLISQTSADGEDSSEVETLRLYQVGR